MVKDFKAKVIILPSDFGNIYINNNENKLQYCQKEKTNTPLKETKHLYIISDDEIKSGDWCYSIRDNWIKQCVNPNKSLEDALQCKKIIATTDSNLRKICISCNGRGQFDKDGYNQCSRCNTSGYFLLPCLSKKFINTYIENYNDNRIGNKIITDVLVEYEEYIIQYLDKPQERLFRPKVKSNNTILVRQSKEYWTKEEAIEQVRKYSKERTGQPWFEEDEKWIEDNF